MVLPPRSKHSKDDDRYLSPEFDELGMEFGLPCAHTGASPKKDAETLSSDGQTPKVYIAPSKNDFEQEVRHLRTVVRILRERERSLETQLLEYYGLKEQETAVMELQNRLKINNMEAKLFNLRIKSLQVDNRRLEAQVTDHAKAVAELEAARAKIKSLKKKIKTDAEQNKEQILILKQKVENFQEHQVSATDMEIQARLQRSKELEIEVLKMRKSNSTLQLENLELAQRLESTQILATSVLEESGVEALKELNCQLKKENEVLGKETERLHADRCGDVEELVYLRWLNACLRYELRNYQPPPGKTVARDLSKSLSPKSEEKAKQLILQYANTEGGVERGDTMPDFDSDRWSPSQASFMTDSTDLEETSSEYQPATRTRNAGKAKFFRKLRKFIRGKDNPNLRRASSMDRMTSPDELQVENSCTSSRCSSRTGRGTYSCTSPSPSPWCTGADASQATSSRLSLDIPRQRNLNAEDVNNLERSSSSSDVAMRACKTFGLGDIGATPSARELASQRSDLVKYAEALKDSREATPKSSLHRKSPALGYF